MNEPEDPDDLSAFAPEQNGESMSRERIDIRAGETDDDWLSVFTKEGEYLSRTLEDEDDFLAEFSEEPSVSEPPAPAAPLSLPILLPAEVRRRSDPWAGPWAAAAIAILISVILGTRSLHPAWWNSGAMPLAQQFAVPNVDPGIPSRMVRQFDTVSIDVPRLPTAIVPAARVDVDRDKHSAAPRPSTLAADRRPVSARLLRESSPPAPIELAPLAPIVVPNRTLAETRGTPIGPTAILPPVTAAKSSEATTQEYAVRTALHSYEQAYEALDVAATAEVWPSVDRRALARAFDTLKSQGLDFKSCAITVMDSSAIARCRGTLEIVRKIGSSMPLTAEQDWVFKMRRLGTNWKIDEVLASQAHIKG